MKTMIPLSPLQAWDKANYTIEITARPDGEGFSIHLVQDGEPFAYEHLSAAECRAIAGMLSTAKLREKL